jgi:hypothetical protein
MILIKVLLPIFENFGKRNPVGQKTDVSIPN